MSQSVSTIGCDGKKVMKGDFNQNAIRATNLYHAFFISNAFFGPGSNVAKRNSNFQKLTLTYLTSSLPGSILLFPLYLTVKNQIARKHMTPGDKDAYRQRRC